MSLTISQWTDMFSRGNGNRFDRAARARRGRDRRGRVRQAGLRPCEPLESRVLLSSVVGRAVFYNNSSWDGTSDDNAIATDKSALLPGQTATFANYTSFTKGINGIMIDVSGLPAGTGPSASDFVFKVGNAADGPSTWTAAPAPTSVTTRRGAGAGGSDRVTITWADATIKVKWLNVQVKPNAVTGLAATDVFYFGNLPGEVGDSSTAAVVTSTDFTQTQSHQNQSATITSPYDFDRSGAINALDITTANNYQQSSIVLFNATPASTTAASLATAPQTTHVSWADNSGIETGYVLEQSATSSFSVVSATYVLPADSTGYDVSIANHATRYYYRVRAVSGTASSANSNVTTESVVFASNYPRLGAEVTTGDDYPRLTRALAACPDYGVLVLEPGVSYNMSHYLDVDRPVNVEGQTGTNGRASELMLTTGNYPDNSQIKVHSQLGTPLTWNQPAGTHIGPGATITIPTATATAIDAQFDVGDLVFIELGDDPYDAEVLTSLEWMEHYSAITKIEAIGTNSITISAADAVPYDIDPGDGSVVPVPTWPNGVDPNQVRPNRITKVTKLVKDVWFNNLRFDFNTTNPNGEMWFFRTQNVLVQNITGRFGLLATSVDSDNFTLRNASGTLVQTQSAGGRVMGSWQSDHTRGENLNVTTNDPTAVVFVESWDRDFYINNITVNWNSTYNSTGDATVFFFTSQSHARIDNATVNNVGKISLVEDGDASQRLSYWSFGHVTVTGPAWFVPLPGVNAEGNSVDTLTLGSGAGARTYDRNTVTSSSQTFNLSANMNQVLDIPDGMYRKVSFRLSNTNGTALTAANVPSLNFTNGTSTWDIDSQPGFYSGATLSWEMIYGDAMPMNNAVSKYLQIVTGGVVPTGTQLTVSYEYW